MLLELDPPFSADTGGVVDPAATPDEAVAWLAGPTPLTVAVVGTALVGPLVEVALRCSLVVVAADASLTLRPPDAPPVLPLGPLVERVGRSVALDWAATGRPVPAHELLARGAAARVAQVRGDGGWAAAREEAAALGAALLTSSYDVVVASVARLGPAGGAPSH